MVSIHYCIFEGAACTGTGTVADAVCTGTVADADDASFVDSLCNVWVEGCIHHGCNCSIYDVALGADGDSGDSPVNIRQI